MSEPTIDQQIQEAAKRFACATAMDPDDVERMIRAIVAPTAREAEQFNERLRHFAATGFRRSEA